MLPLSYDIRTYYRKHQNGETVTASGAVIPTHTMDGPYKVAFRPGGRSKGLTEGGYSFDASQFYVIADACRAWEPGDIMTDDPAGENELYKVDVVKTFPTEQQMYVREV